MNLFAISGLSVAFPSLILAFITFFFGKTKLHRLLVFFNLAVSGWGIGLYLVGIAHDTNSALFAWKIAHLTGLFVAPLFFHITCLFCGIKRRKAIIVGYSQAIFFILVTLFTPIFINKLNVIYNIYFIKAGVFYSFAVFCYIIFFIFGFIELLKFLTISIGHRKTQTWYNILGFFFGFIGGTTTFLPMYNINLFYPLGNFGITIYSLILTYAILRHHLMDIQLVIKKAIIYSLTAGLITSLFVVIILLFTKTFSSLFRIDSFIITAIAALIIAIIFQPLKLSLENIIDKYFYKSKVDYSFLIKNIFDKLSTIVNQNEIRKFVIDSLVFGLHLEHAVIHTRQKNLYEIFYLKNKDYDNVIHSDNNKSHLIDYSSTSTLVQLLLERKNIVRKDALVNSIEDHLVESIEQVLEPKGGEIVVPVFVDKELTDIIILGRKSSGDSYTDEDINFLQTVASHLSISLKNAALYKELETQVEEKTKEIAVRKKVEGEKKTLMTQLQQSQKMEAIGQLAGGISHDFNNILFVILGYCDLIHTELIGQNKRLAEDVAVIKDAARKAADLTSQLLAFSRKQVLEMQTVCLEILIQDMTKMLIRMIGENIELRLNFDNHTHQVLADPSQIEQVLMNLIINARHAMPNGGKLMIETTDVVFGPEIVSYREEFNPGHYTMLSVSDTGSGISREVQERIFEPFFTTKEKGKGTGLGLSTVYGIVKQHKGYIYVYSEPGHGTMFKVYLPIDPGENNVEENDIVTEKQKGKETILIAEDEPSLLTYLVRVLEPLGYKLLTAANGQEAISTSKAYKDNIHLLLTDVIMPGMDGRALSEKLCQDRPNMKVIYMSGYTHDVIGQHGVLEKGVHFIQKPVSLNELTHEIRSALEENDLHLKGE